MAKLRDVLLWAASRVGIARPSRNVRLISEAPADERLPIDTILVLKLDRIGDFVVGLEACRRLRAHWPKARITCVAASWNLDIARESGLFDAVVAYDFFTRTVAKHRQPMADRIERFRALKLRRQDVAIDLRYDDDTRPLLAEIDAGLRVGYAMKRGEARLDIALPRYEEAAAKHGAPPISSGDRLSLLVEALAIARPPVASPAPISSRRNGPIVMTPGAGFAVKRWPAERWVELALDLARAEPAPLVLLGGPEDKAFNAGVAEAIRAKGGAIDDRTAATPMGEVIATIAAARLFIGLDSGLSHVAAERGVPTVTIFSGHADPAVWMPRGPNAFGIHAKIACAPCGLKDVRYCRAEHACMRGIPLDAVRELVDRALRRG